MLASGSTDKTVQLWNTDTGKLLATLNGHINGVTTLTFSPTSNTLVSGSTDGTIKFWNTNTGTLQSSHITGHTKWNKALVLSKDISTLASVAFNGIITFWDLNTFQQNAVQMKGHQDLLPALAFSPDGGKLVSIGSRSKMVFDPGFGRRHTASVHENELIRLTDTSTGNELMSIEDSIGVVSELTFSPDGKMVAIGGYDNRIRLWDTEIDTFFDITLSDEKIEVETLMFSRDGNKLVIGTRTGKVQMLNLEIGVESSIFAQYNSAIEAVTFSSNSSLLAVASRELVHILGSNKLNRLKEIPNGALSLAFSPDNAVLVAGLANGQIDLWHVESGDSLSILHGHTGLIESLVFSPDGKTLVSTGEDGTILVWDWDEVLKKIGSVKE
ncbi:WD40 repeat domain-containing protein [Candidatus Poribacteria bacterium]|nr:WD40 repeat domain-containing protein [Candidatus Poribacteria bacterium]